MDEIEKLVSPNEDDDDDVVADDEIDDEIGDVDDDDEDDDEGADDNDAADDDDDDDPADIVEGADVIDDLGEDDSIIDDETSEDDEKQDPISDSIITPKIDVNLDDLEDSDIEDDDYLKKFANQVRSNLIEKHHPEVMMHNYEEISALTPIVKDKDNIINDPLHKTTPYLTKYERTRVLGQRAKQINDGARPYIDNTHNILDGYLIAEKELEQKKIPFIIRRPLPSGGTEYWKLSDLELI